MKRIYKGSDLKFNVIFPACEHDITLRFYTTNSSNYITVDDESIISGQITLKWDSLATLEEGVLYYDVDSTGDLNSVTRQQTDYYIVTGLNSSNIGGGSTVVNAQWGKIQGDITAQTDLVEYINNHGGSGSGESYDDTAIKNDIATINVTLSTKANKADVYTKAEVDAKGYITGVPAEYVTETELANKGYLTEHQDISNLATKSEIPTNISQLSNDSGYLTSVPEEYITESELNAKGYITEHQDISNLATTETVNALDARITALENDVTSANQTLDEINSMI